MVMFVHSWTLNGKEGCHKSFSPEYLCPFCNLPACEEDSQQVLGGVMCELENLNIRIKKLKEVCKDLDERVKKLEEKQ